MSCLFGLALFHLSSVQAAAEGVLEAGMINPGFHEPPPWFKVSFLDIREDAEDAAAEGKRLMLYFYQDGCPYCGKLINDNFGQHAIAQKTQQHFDVIAINMWGDREVTGFDGKPTNEKDFTESLRVMFTPTLLILDEELNIIARINGYYAPHQFMALLEWAGEGKEKTISLREYLARNDRQPATGKLHVQPGYIGRPYRLADALRVQPRPMVVMFEQQVCADCDALHLDILAREESKKLLEPFHVSLLDKWASTPVQTPDGERTTMREWADQLDIHYAPSMVFFDAKGKEVFRTEGFLRTFHVQSILDYVASGAYIAQPNFQRYIDDRAHKIRDQGIVVDLLD
jgi:thioredoxin-related protein